MVHIYQLQYNAPSEPQLAVKIVEMLQSNGVPSKLDKSRDWDHGVFIPLKVMYPNADIPVVAVSCCSCNHLFTAVILSFVTIINSGVMSILFFYPLFCYIVC